MAELTTVARPYAQALFRLAKEAKTQEDWSGRLARLALIASDEKMARVIGNPKFSTKEITDLLFSLCDDKKCRELEVFLALLADNERLSLLPHIQVLFEHFKDADEGIKEAAIESAFPMAEKETKSLIAQLEKHFSTRLRPIITVVPELLGGIRATVGGEVFDASVRGKLNAMRVELKKN